MEKIDVKKEVIEQVNALRREIHRAVRKEFKRRAVRCWVRHELEEILGNIIYNNVDWIAERIVDEVTKKLKDDLKDIEEKIIKDVSEYVKNKLDLDSYISRERIKERIDDMIEIEVKRRILFGIEDKINDLVEKEFENYKPLIKEKIEKMSDTMIAELVIKQLSIVLDEVRMLKDEVFRIKSNMTSMNLNKAGEATLY